MMILFVIRSCGGPSDKSNGRCLYGRLDEYRVRRAHISLRKVIAEIVGIGRKTSAIVFMCVVRQRALEKGRRKALCSARKRPSRNVIIIRPVQQRPLFFFRPSAYMIIVITPNGLLWKISLR